MAQEAYAACRLTPSALKLSSPPSAVGVACAPLEGAAPEALAEAAGQVAANFAPRDSIDVTTAQPASNGSANKQWPLASK